MVIEKNSEFDIFIGSNIRKNRHRLGISAPQLADLCNVGHQIIYDYEKGRVKLPSSMAYMIAFSLGFDVRLLFSGNSNGARNFNTDPEMDDGENALRQLENETLKRHLILLCKEVSVLIDKDSMPS